MWCLGCSALLMFVIVPSAFASSVGGCQLQGTANFSPGLNSSTQPFSYNFGGALSGCQSSEATVPTSGTVGDPTTFTIATDRFAGDSATGLLLFQPPDPTACSTSTGATTAAISGGVSLSGS